MKNKGFILLVAIMIISVTLVTFVSKTYSLFTSRDQVTNELRNGNVDVEINENGFKDIVKWNGTSTNKVVTIVNKSNVDTLIRVAVVLRWVDEKGEPWMGDTSLVNVVYPNLSDGQEVGNSKWVKDGYSKYYYYNTLVSENNETSPLIQSVEASIPNELKERYNGKKLIVDIKAETVQGTKAGYNSVWSDRDKTIDSMLDKLCKN